MRYEGDYGRSRRPRYLRDRSQDPVDVRLDSGLIGATSPRKSRRTTAPALAYLQTTAGNRAVVWLMASSRERSVSQTTPEETSDDAAGKLEPRILDRQAERGQAQFSWSPIVQRQGPAGLVRGGGRAAYSGAKNLAKRLGKLLGRRAAAGAHSRAGRKALKRLSDFGIDKRVADHIADHFVMIPGKVKHGLFSEALRNTAAVKGLVTETLKKASSPILSKTDSGALAWVFEAEIGRVIGSHGKTALTRMRVVTDMKGRLVTAFPISGFTKTVTIAGMRGLRVTLASGAAIVSVQVAYESEANAAKAARESFEKRNEPSWWEYLLPMGPPSRMGYEVRPRRIQERAVAMTETVESALGRPLSEVEKRGITADVRSMWY